jgi:hypothetical protein
MLVHLPRVRGSRSRDPVAAILSIATALSAASHSCDTAQKTLAILLAHPLRPCAKVHLKVRWKGTT